MAGGEEGERLPPAIFAAARREFLAWGFEGANIDRMAQAARVSKSRFYEVAPDKGALFRRVMRAVMQPVIRSDLPALSGPPEEALVALGCWLVRANMVPDNMGMNRIAITLGRSLPLLAADIGHWRRIMLQPALLYFGRLQAEGVLVFADAETAFVRFALMATGGYAPLFGESLPEERVLATAATQALLFGHAARERGEALQALAGQPGERAGGRGEVLAGRRARQTRLAPAKFAELLEEAARAFLAHGFRRTTMAAIVRQTGVAKTTIYRQFGDKEGLFAAVLQHLLAGERASLPLGRDVPAALAAAADVLSARFRAPRHLALLRLLIAEMPQFPALCRQTYRELWRPEMLQLESWFAALARQGLLLGALRPFAAAHFFILAVDGFVHLTGQQRPPSRGSEVAGVFLYGCGGREVRRRAGAALLRGQ